MDVMSDMVYRECQSMLTKVLGGSCFRFVDVGMLINLPVHRMLHHLLFGFTPDVVSGR